MNLGASARNTQGTYSRELESPKPQERGHVEKRLSPPFGSSPPFQQPARKGNSKPKMGHSRAPGPAAESITSDEYFSLTDGDRPSRGAPKAAPGLASSAASRERDARGDFGKEVSRSVTGAELGGFWKSTPKTSAVAHPTQTGHSGEAFAA